MLEVGSILEAGLRRAGGPATLAIGEGEAALAAAGVAPGDLIRLGQGALDGLIRTAAAWRLGAAPMHVGEAAIDLAPGDARVWRWDGAVPTLERDGGGAAPFDDPVAVVHASSGSVAPARLIARRQSSVVAEWHRYAAVYGLVPGEAALVCAPAFHSFGWGALFGCAAAGCRTLATIAFHPRNVRRRLNSGQVAVLVVTPQMLRLLLKPGYDPSPGLRCIIAGAGPVSRDLDVLCRRELGIGVSRNYGSTETGATVGGPPRDDEALGPPFPAVDVVSPGLGETGPLVLRLSERAEPYATGEIARYELDGAVRIVRRETAMVKLNGYSVSLEEIARFAAGHVGIEDAAALVRARAAAPEILDLYLVFCGEASEEALRSSLLEAFPVLRASLRLRRVARLPRNAVGKLAQADLQVLLGTLVRAETER